MTDRPRPDLSHLDDPDWVSRFIARSGIVEGHDDDGEVREQVKRKRSPQIFRERDVTRAVSAHLKAGVAVAGTKFTRDGFMVITGKPEQIELAPDQQSAEAVNEWDTPL